MDKRVRGAPSVLFLCLGNICRSPMAEGAARAACAAAGVTAHVDSAGTSDWHSSEPPDDRAIAEAARHGVDLSPLRARQLAASDYRDFDLILAADADNLATLRARAPGDARATLALMFDMVPGRAGEALADPWYGDARDFERCWRDVTAVAEALVQRLSQHG